MPDEVAARDADENGVSIGKLVQDFLEAQSLKILPQAPFSEAVHNFVKNDDKHAVEALVSESLDGQLKQMLRLDTGDDEEEPDIESAMERYRARQEEQFAAGQFKTAQKRILKERPEDWDSDMDGHWEDQEGVVAFESVASAPQQPGRSNGSGARAAQKSAPARSSRAAPARRRMVDDDGDDDDDFLMVDARETTEPSPPPKKAAPRGRAAKGTAEPKTTTGAAKTKAAPTKKPPARSARSRRPFLLDDDDDDEEDVFMEDAEDFEESAAPPPPPPPAARTTRRTTAPKKQPARGIAATAAAVPARAPRQTRLNFSQGPSQAASKTKSQASAALEISDDAISEEDDFESMDTRRGGRR